VSSLPKTYGRFWLKDSTWHVACEPHVMIRLKRTFDKVRKDQYDVITLADSPETCRELLWFTLRFPLTAIDEPTQFYLEEQAEKHEREEKEVHLLLSGEVEPKNFKLRLPLRPYQRIATDLALKTGGLLIADDLGTGKTACIIGMFTDQRTRPALVATLAHLTYQWQAEINRFAPELTTHIIKQGKFYQFSKDNIFPDVLITSYYKLHSWAEHLAGKIRCVAFDEIQELRHGEMSLKGSASFHISDQASFRVGASATPFYNYGAEMFNIMKALRPGVLGTFSEFAREWLSWDGKKLKDPKAFGTYLRDHGYMIRRTREDIRRTIPTLTKVPHWIDFDFEALDALKSSADELALSIVRYDPTIDEETQKDKFARENEFKQLLRQATGIGKAPYVAEFVRMLVETGEQVVVFLWHRECYSILKDRLSDYKPSMYTGSESPQRKRKQFNRFVRKETPILLISLRSGAGLDGLQYHCRTVVFGELDWSPGVMEQCLTMETEILTKKGFCKENEVEVGDEVAAFDIKDSSIKWKPVLHKVCRKLGKKEKLFYTETKKMAFKVTGDHRLIVRRSRRTISGENRSDWKFKLAKDVAGKNRRFVPTCGLEKTIGVDLTSYELRFLGWYISDGSFNGNQVTIYQAAHQPWNDDIVEVLNGCEFTWYRYERINTNGNLLYMYCVPKGNVQRWTKNEISTFIKMKKKGVSYKEIEEKINRPRSSLYKRWAKFKSGYKYELIPPKNRTTKGWEYLEKYLDKNLSPLLENVTREQLINIIHGLYMGDGTKNESRENVVMIGGTNKILFDRLQSLCVRRGMSATISTHKKPKDPNRKISHTIYISKFEDAYIPGPNKPNVLSEVEPTKNEKVWCVTNELGTLVTRYNGKVAVVGNCIGRVHRDGQLDDVTAYFLLANGGSDPYVSELLGIKRAQIEGVKDPEGAVLPNYDLDNVSVKELALNYMNQRQEGKAVEVMPTNRKNLETYPLESEESNIKAYLTDEIKIELSEGLANFTKENDLLDLIDKELLTGFLNSLGLKPSKKLHKKLVKNLCLSLLEAACRATINDRKVIKTHDL